MRYFFQVEDISLEEVFIDVNNLLLKYHSACSHSLGWEGGSAVLRWGILSTSSVSIAYVYSPSFLPWSTW